jgi:hypothetical protein
MCVISRSHIHKFLEIKPLCNTIYGRLSRRRHAWLEAARGLEPHLVYLHCRHFGETTFAKVSRIRIVDLPANPSHVRSCPLMFYNMTSDHRVVGSSPAGCKLNSINGLGSILRQDISTFLSRSCPNSALIHLSCLKYRRKQRSSPSAKRFEIEHPWRALLRSGS